MGIEDLKDIFIIWIRNNWVSVSALIVSVCSIFCSIYLYKWRLKKEIEIKYKEKHFGDVKDKVLTPLYKEIDKILENELKIVSETFPYVWYLEPSESREREKEFLKYPQLGKDVDKELFEDAKNNHFPELQTIDKTNNILTENFPQMRKFLLQLLKEISHALKPLYLLDKTPTPGDKNWQSLHYGIAAILGKLFQAEENLPNTDRILKEEGKLETIEKIVKDNKENEKLQKLINQIILLSEEIRENLKNCQNKISFILKSHKELPGKCDYIK